MPQGVILVFDVNDRKSFESLDMWLKEATDNGLKCSNITLCANKSDGGKKRAVSEADGRKYATSRKLEYCETSAKEGESVKTMFMTLFSRVMASQK